MGPTGSPPDSDGATSSRGGYDAARKFFSRQIDEEAREGPAPTPQALCRAATAALGLTAVVIRLIPSEVDPGVVIAGTAIGQELSALEGLYGEGPGRTAHLARRPVLVGDLGSEGARRWPGFANAALEAGVAAVFVVPLAVGAARLGTMEGFGAKAGPLSPAATEIALGFAQLATELLTSPTADGTRPGIDEEIGRALAYRAEIAQAQGMVTVDLDVDLVEALVLLRARAFAENKTLLELAREIKDGYRLPKDLKPHRPGGPGRKEGHDDKH